MRVEKHEFSSYYQAVLTFTTQMTMDKILKLELAVAALLILLALIEAIVLHSRTKGNFDWWELKLSFADQVGHRLIAALPLMLVAPVLEWLWLHRIYTIKLNSVVSFLLLFIGLEFCYYWYHRTAHRVRLFWATHMVHHSPNQLSLSAALRLGWMGRLTGTSSALFLTPLIFIGFEPKVVLAALSLNLLYQFWVHATWIPKLGWLEYIFNTPSAHRVHHASNLDYLDANYGGVLIIFDRLFGTYVQERDDLPCVYGLVKPIRTHNLLRLELDQWISLLADLRGTRSLRTALGYLMMPPGWAPNGKGQTTEDLRKGASSSQ